MRTRAGSTSENKGKEVIVNDSELSETIAIPAPLPEPFLQGGRFYRTCGRFHRNPQSIYEENILSINHYIYWGWLNILINESVTYSFDVEYHLIDV